ncbi:MAG TPA: DUF1844 domain-containing protein [Planctomycetota bacterium]|jgi:hypothetical protein|nr:DUF1844 domain-containing protein [Planctomycetota bacterium]
MSDKSVDHDWKNRVSEERRRQEEEEARRAAEKQETRETSVPATFMNFMSEYAMRGMVLLGQIPYPGSDDRVIDIAGARYTIDILAVIQDKTKNNLSKDEESYMRNALYELRLRFVDVSEKITAGKLKEGPQGSAAGMGEEADEAPTGLLGEKLPGAANGAPTPDPNAKTKPRIIVP